ncbi:MAG: double-strand break repair helicase AddA [Salaquimonas sp.]
MSDVVNIHSSVNERQSIATNPELSIWVSANAGSGKTYVLSRRVIRLLLEGNKPSELLCLTFTKAAAAEMSNRVFKHLGEWAMMEDRDLEAAIHQLTGRKAARRDLVQARKLFALALDTPGGLRIQTIHAFCESLLHQFPLEANIPGQFEMMDDLDQQALMELARRNVILTSLGLKTDGSATENALAEQLDHALSAMREFTSDGAIDEAISHLIYNRDPFEAWINKGGGNAASAIAPAWDGFGLSSSVTAISLYEEFASQSEYDDISRQKLIQLASAKTAQSYQTLLEQLEAIKNCSDAQVQHRLRCQVFLTQKLEKRKSLVNKSFLKEEPEQEELFIREQDILLAQLNRMKTLKVLRASEALFTVAQAILIEYATLKQERSLLDFGDLISKTASLLNRKEISAWIQYKLDSGISHILVDEAQDTSPLQWEIIEAITQEFYSGKGTKEKIRTTFVVGDEKQSIYSFQGADPRKFNEQYRSLRKKTKDAQLDFETVGLSVSFRSTDEVLSAVDQVFSLEENARGLGLDTRSQPHTANRMHDRGEVVLWPPELKPKKVEKTDWRTPPGDETEAEAEIRLADKISTTIKSWIDGGKKLPGRDKPIRYGDILILVRKRDRFVTAMNRALKQKGLTSAGADRLKLTEHIAIEDLMAIGRFASMEMDDLALAGALKSPLFDFNEEELFAICDDRDGLSIWQRIKKLIDDEVTQHHDEALIKKLIGAWHILKMIQRDAASLPVYEFFARLFARTSLRQKYLERLGHEVEEVLDGFFQAAMNYDNRNGLGLQGFIEGLELTKPELKREIDMATNEIRVITTHSSKGLEAPIVFLVDPGTKAYETRHAPPIINYKTPSGHSLMLWQAKKDDRIDETGPVYERIESDAEEEYRRLLYVAMTRAADRLIICGYRPEEEPKYPYWYKMIENGLAAECDDKKLGGKLVPVIDESGNEIARQWLIKKSHKEVALVSSKQDAATDKPHNPEWIKPAPTEPVPPRPLSPSGVLELLDIAPDADTRFINDNNFALERGTAIHNLLQILPPIDAEKRETVIGKYFSLSGHGLSQAIQSEISVSLLMLLETPRIRDLYTCQTRAEVELSGKLYLNGREHMVRGKIDLLIVEDGTVTIADYKTNRQIPGSPMEVSADYLAQLALYRELIKELYASFEVKCQLIWTENASIMPIADALLDEQLERIRNHRQKVLNG